jgi:hypothetical protein
MGLSEDVNHRKTDNAMAKEKVQTDKQWFTKFWHIKIDINEPH